ncbi:MAG TPA: cell division protein ZapA [Pseudobacteroides sp.]|uniref:cell division protein ZapA n=1 Tax=Pseudobacteroides sp. TaxID=1968840 RepID=UPI002F932F0C
MEVKNKVNIRVAGKDYTLVGVESEEYLQKIGLYIDKKMNEIMKVNTRLSTSMAAVLTAINIADDYFKSFEEEKRLQKELDDAQAELERLKEANKALTAENAALQSKNTDLQLELAKKEVELGGVKSTIGKVRHR